MSVGTSTNTCRRRRSRRTTRKVCGYAEKCLIALPQVMKLGCREKTHALEAQASTYKRRGYSGASVSGRWETHHSSHRRVDHGPRFGRCASEASWGCVRDKMVSACSKSPTKLQERCLDDDERVLDVLAYWDRMQLQDKKKRRKSAITNLCIK